MRDRAETALLAAIHVWAVHRVPRLVRIRPSEAAPGETVILEGHGLEGHDLRVHFGPVETWAVPLSPRAILTVVPAAASGPLPVAVSRQGLRSNTVSWDGPPGDGPGRVVRIDPEDGATGVFTDDPIVVTLSLPADLTTLTAETFRVTGEDGEVKGQRRASPDARVLIWTPDDFLTEGATHHVRIAGLRDLRGREMAEHQSTFVPCRFSALDLMA